MRQPVPFGKYLLLDRISVGGMAEVFKAKSYGVEGFEKIIAIKRILPSMGEDRDFIKMFIDEAKIAGQLQHANIGQIFELGRIDGSHFIAMEYIWGKDLLQIQNRLRKAKQPMPVALACYAIAKICEGLDYAHRKKDPLGRPLEIVHRDCSPQNALISFEGEIKVIDFGIAKATSRSSRTMAGVLKGKFGYMSPEQVRGLPLDRRSDIFAIGTILYECLSGDRVFSGETDFATLDKVRNVEIVPPRQANPEIPVEVEKIILRAMAKDVEDRYQWCSDMASDLQRYLMAQPQVVSPKGLSTWLRDLFAADFERERQALDQFRRMGRDGLIAGMPAAEAKVDVIEQLGEAGQAEDPTMLGGPEFDEFLSEAKPGANAAAGLPGVPAATGAGDFVDEAATSLFGEDEIDRIVEREVAIRRTPPGDPAATPIVSTPSPAIAARANGYGLAAEGDAQDAPTNYLGNRVAPPPGMAPRTPTPAVGQGFPGLASGRAPTGGYPAMGQAGPSPSVADHRTMLGVPAPTISGRYPAAGTGTGAYPQAPSPGQGYSPIGTGGYGSPHMGRPMTGQMNATGGPMAQMPGPMGAPNQPVAEGVRHAQNGIGRDIAIGMGIAIIALGLFALVKFVILS